MERASVDAERTSIAAGLTKILDDTRALEAKTGRFLRDVTGPASALVRPLLDKQRGDLGLAIERIANAMLALGLAPRRPRTPSPSSLHRGPVWTAEEMLACLVREHELLVRRTEGVLRHTEKASDDATSDLLRQRIEEHEAAAWVLVAVSAAELLREQTGKLER